MNLLIPLVPIKNLLELHREYSSLKLLWESSTNREALSSRQILNVRLYFVSLLSDTEDARY